MKSILAQKNAGRFQINVRLQCRKETNYIEFAAPVGTLSAAFFIKEELWGQNNFKILLKPDGETQKPQFFCVSLDVHSFRPHFFLPLREIFKTS